MLQGCSEENCRVCHSEVAHFRVMERGCRKCLITILSLSILRECSLILAGGAGKFAGQGHKKFATPLFEVLKKI